jgi:hypothetical protein
MLCLHAAQKVKLPPGTALDTLATGYLMCKTLSAGAGECIFKVWVMLNEYHEVSLTRTRSHRPSRTCEPVVQRMQQQHSGRPLLLQEGPAYKGQYEQFCQARAH